MLFPEQNTVPWLNLSLSFSASCLALYSRSHIHYQDKETEPCVGQILGGGWLWNLITRLSHGQTHKRCLRIFPCSPTSCDCSITMATIIYSVNSSGDRYLLPAGSTLGLEFLEEFRDAPVRSQRHLLCCFEQLLDLWLLYFVKAAEIKFSLHANYCQKPARFPDH